MVGTTVTNSDPAPSLARAWTWRSRERSSRCTVGASTSPPHPGRDLSSDSSYPRRESLGCKDGHLAWLSNPHSHRDRDQCDQPSHAHDASRNEEHDPGS